MELKETKVEVGDDVVNKEVKELPKEVEEKSIMQCSSNFEDQSFYNVEDQSEDQFGGGGGGDETEVDEDEVDVVGYKGFKDKDETDVSECNDATDECTSSFSGTGSGDENENDQEADSMMCKNDASLPLWVRKKKVTDHWKRFIQPVMWRSKWVELKFRELQNQARLYDKELEETRKAKKLELENLKPEEFGVKGLPPLACQTQKTQIMKRKKRKRVEETIDVASYTSNHNLFSYNEERKSFADISLNDNSRNLDKTKSSKEGTLFTEDIPPLEFREGDEYLEQILLKIEAAKVEARNLKNRVDKMVNENPSRFSPVNTVNLLGSADAFTSPEPQKPQLVVKNEDAELVMSEEKPVKSASISSHQGAPEDAPEGAPEDAPEGAPEGAPENAAEGAPKDDETTDILLSELLASRKKEGKAVVPDKKLPKTEQTSVEEGPSRPVRKRTPRNLDIVKEEPTPKKRKGSREKPKTNVTMASRFKGPNRKRKRGKRRSGSAGLRRRT